MDLKEILLKTPKADLAKAVGEAYGLQGIHDIRDLWDDMHKLPTAEEITHGPAAAATGAAAEKMVSEYSNVAPQVGITAEYMTMNKLIEGWGTTIKSSLDSLAEAIKAGNPFEKKDEKEHEDKEKKDEKKDMKKADEWSGLAEVETRLAKAVSAQLDPDLVADAQIFVEQAEELIKKSDKLKESNPQESGMYSAKAQKAMKKARRALKKANVLARYGLVGHGNQKDEAVSTDKDRTGDPDGPTSKSDMSPKKALKLAYKARLHAAKAAKYRGMVGGLTKAEMEEEEKDKTKKKEEEAKKSLTPESPANITAGTTPTPGQPGVVPPEIAATAAIVPGEAAPNPANHAAKADSVESDPAAAAKAMSDRIAMLEAQLKDSRQPQITPVILKSGIKNEATAALLVDRITMAQEAGELSSGGAEVALSLVDRFRAASNGHIPFSIVEQQLGQAPSDVRMFFDSVSQPSA